MNNEAIENEINRTIKEYPRLKIYKKKNGVCYEYKVLKKNNNLMY